MQGSRAATAALARCNLAFGDRYFRFAGGASLTSGNRYTVDPKGMQTLCDIDTSVEVQAAESINVSFPATYSTC